MSESRDGYTDAGSPPPSNAEHKRRMRQGNLSDNAALQEYENPVPGQESKGFLKRNNYGDRY